MVLSHKQQGILYAISSGLCYGLLGYFGATLMKQGFSVSGMLFWRFFIAAIFMLLVLIPWRKDIFKMPIENLKLIGYGIVFYSTSSVTYFISSKYVGTGLGMVIFFIYPAFVMLINSLYYKLPIQKNYYFAFLLILTGMLFLADITKSNFSAMGMALGIISAVLYALYIIPSKKTPVSPAISTLMILIGCSIMCFVLAVGNGDFFVPTRADSWVKIISVAIICTAIPILLLLQSMRFLSSEQASILSVLEPIFVVFFGVLLLHEKVTPTQIMGTAITLSGAILTLLPAKRYDEIIDESKTSGV